MGMDRFTAGGVASSASLNKAMDEIDYQSLACGARTTTAVSLNPNTDYIVAWGAEDYDTLGGGMWDPATPTFELVRVDGIYFLECQLRYGAVTTASPYSTGERAGKLLLNTTDVNATAARARPIKSAKVPASVSGEGTTLTLTRTFPLYAGDRIYVNTWHSAAAQLMGLQTDFGGSYLSLSRLGPLA